MHNLHVSIQLCIFLVNMEKKKPKKENKTKQEPEKYDPTAGNLRIRSHIIMTKHT